MIAHPKPIHITPREREVWRLAALGLPNKQIADRLNVSLGCVEKQRVLLQRKIRTNNPADLAIRAVECGIIAVTVRPLVAGLGNKRWPERWVLPV